MAEKNIEVEVKARADDLAATEEQVKQTARPAGAIDYKDTYFTFENVEGYTHHRFRLRETRGKAWVTAKEKLDSQRVDANVEHEFQVSDPGAFRRFAAQFGFKVLVTKQKKGKRYTLELGEQMPGHQASIELVEVQGLGSFVEIEIMVDHASKVEPARKIIQQVLDKLQVPKGAIEPAPYTYLIYHLENPGEDTKWNG